MAARSSVVDLTARRLATIAYLRSVLAGAAAFGVVALAPVDFGRLLGAPALAKLTRQLAVLALSLGRLASLRSSGDVLRGAAQLFVEFEHYCGDTIVPDALRAIRLMRGGGTSASGDPTAAHPDAGVDDDVDPHYPDTLPPIVAATAPITPTLHTAGGAVVYEHLLVATPLVRARFATCDRLRLSM